MTKCAAQIAELCRKAISGDAQYFSNDIPALRRTAVANVKNLVIRQRKTNAIMDEWLTEVQKRASLRK